MDTQSVYAIITAGGKQHRVKVGQRHKFENIAGEPGDSIELGEILMIGNGDKLNIGTPFLDKGKVTAKILSHGRGDKIKIFKMRRRKGYRKTQGHRQGFTEVEITNIQH